MQAPATITTTENNSSSSESSSERTNRVPVANQWNDRAVSAEIDHSRSEDRQGGISMQNAGALSSASQLCSERDSRSHGEDGVSLDHSENVMIESKASEHSIHAMEEEQAPNHEEENEAADNVAGVRSAPYATSGSSFHTSSRIRPQKLDDDVGFLQTAIDTVEGMMHVVPRTSDVECGDTVAAAGRRHHEDEDLPPTQLPLEEPVGTPGAFRVVGDASNIYMLHRGTQLSTRVEAGTSFSDDDKLSSKHDDVEVSAELAPPSVISAENVHLEDHTAHLETIGKGSKLKFLMVAHRGKCIWALVFLIGSQALLAISFRALDVRAPSSAPSTEFTGSDGPDVVLADDETATFYSRPELDAAIDAYLGDPNQEAYDQIRREYGQDINDWKVGRIRDFSNLFDSRTGFNEPINSWDVSQATSLHGIFQECKLFNQDISTWNTSSVTDISYAFNGATRFRGIGIGGWNVTRVEDANNAFNGAQGFEGDLSTWHVGHVTNMFKMFGNTHKFSGTSLSTWDVGRVNDMSYMFIDAKRFKGDLSTWNVSRVETMYKMFKTARAFNSDLSAWDVSHVTDMGLMFSNATSFNGNVSTWNMSRVTRMTSMFQNATSFQSDLSSWDVSHVKYMSNVFKFATLFDSDLTKWNVSGVTAMNFIFFNATSFNGDLSAWDVSRLTLINSMFHGANSFNRDLSTWNVSNMESMRNMFWNAASFNSDLSSWDVSRVTSMISMFHGAESFNRDLAEWDVSRVATMSSMFKGAKSFNGDISKWNVSRLVNTSSMFQSARSFNRSMSAWDVSMVMDARRMFLDATSFRQDLCSWGSKLNRSTNAVREVAAFSRSCLAGPSDMLVFSNNSNCSDCLSLGNFSRS